MKLLFSLSPLIVPLVLVFSGHSISATKLTKCDQSKLSIRKSLNRLNRHELSNYLKAVTHLASGPQPTQWQTLANKVWDRLTQPSSSRNETLPWQRMLLYEAEQEIKKYDPSVNLGYWDWSQSMGRGIISDPILSREKLGEIKNGTCSLFTQMRGFNPERFDTETQQVTCIQRDLDFEERGYPDFKEIDRSYLNSLTLGQFNAKIHSLIPTYDPQTKRIQPVQPEDPLFYPYLAFIDKLWFDWQKRGQDHYHRSLEPGNTLLKPWGVPFKQLVDPCSRLCYSYLEDHFSWSGSNSPPTGMAHECRIY